MGDVLALLLVAFLTLAGLVALSLITRTTRRHAELFRRDTLRRLREDLRDTDEYIDKVRNALSQDDLDSIDDNRKQEF